MKKKILFLSTLSLSFFMLLTACNGGNKESKETEIPETPEEYVDVLPDNNNGNIMQCFNWTFNEIKENLPLIAHSGFKVVQTSPVQQPKNGGANWYSFYQPLSFSIADNSRLGTKQELKDLCDEADKLGVRVICDIVFNHLANVNDETLESDGTPTVCPDVNNYEPYIYEHRNDASNPTFHHNPKAQGSGAITQVYSFGKLPDLNTANEYVQERCLSLLKECIDVGVDGFRFDAAKHIETPDDPQFASNFWPNTLGVAKEYYKAKTNEDLIAYGEILNDPDGNRSIECYTKLMKVTDNTYIQDIHTAAGATANAEKAVNARYGKDTSPSNLVTWVESHDTYIEETSHISDRKTSRKYAIIASRKDTVAMYLARCDQAATVGMVGSYFFEEEVIAASNRFHNRYAGYDEEQSAAGNVYINERFKENKSSGALLVNLKGKGEAEVTFKHLEDAIYYDQLTGAKVTVKDHKATLNFDDTGLVFLTRTNNLPRPSIEISQRDLSFAGSLKIDVTVKNANSMSYSINDGSEVTFNGTTSITLTDSSAALTTIKFKAANEQFSIEKKSTYKKVELVEGYLNIVNINPSYFDIYDFYYWAWGGGSNGKWLNDFENRNGVLLFDFSNKPYTGFLLAAFNKGYTISNVNEWDSHLVKQTSDISTSAKFYDASNF